MSRRETRWEFCSAGRCESAGRERRARVTYRGCPRAVRVPEHQPEAPVERAGRHPVPAPPGTDEGCPRPESTSQGPVGEDPNRRLLSGKIEKRVRMKTQESAVTCAGHCSAPYRLGLCAWQIKSAYANAECG